MNREFSEVAMWVVIVMMFTALILESYIFVRG